MPPLAFGRCISTVYGLIWWIPTALSRERHAPHKYPYSRLTPMVPASALPSFGRSSLPDPNIPIRFRSLTHVFIRYLEVDPMLLVSAPGSREERTERNSRFHTLNQAIVQLVSHFRVPAVVFTCSAAMLYYPTPPWRDTLDTVSRATTFRCGCTVITTGLWYPLLSVYRRCAPRRPRTDRGESSSPILGARLDGP